jgi:hypothetical protein
MSITPKSKLQWERTSALLGQDGLASGNRSTLIRTISDLKRQILLPAYTMAGDTKLAHIAKTGSLKMGPAGATPKQDPNLCVVATALARPANPASQRSGANAQAGGGAATPSATTHFAMKSFVVPLRLFVKPMSFITVQQMGLMGARSIGRGGGEPRKTVK